MAATSKPVPTGADVSTWLTLDQACDFLGCSRSTIKLWTDKGKLHPVMRRHAHHNRDVMVVDPRELMLCPRKVNAAVDTTNAGEVEARAFALFDRGAPLREVVQEVRRPLAEVEVMHQSWLDAGGSLLVVNPHAHAELSRLVGEFSSVSQLIDRVRSIASAIDRVRSIANANENVCSIEVALPVDVDAARAERAINAALDAAGAP